MQGKGAPAAEDVAAILRVVRHVSGFPHASWIAEFTAWRTLEDVLRLLPPGKELPAIVIPELPPLIRQARQEQRYWE